MEQAGLAWIDELRQYNREALRKEPVPPRDSLTAAEETQCQIIGGALLAWLRQHGPAMLSERKVLARSLDVDPEPYIVFTSNTPGLVAALEVLKPNEKRVIAVSDDLYRRWEADHPDPNFRWHAHYWSLFRDQCDSRLVTRAQAIYPIDDPWIYWQHSEGTLWGARCGVEAQHLWKWDGHQIELLEEAFEACQF